MTAVIMDPNTIFKRTNELRAGHEELREVKRSNRLVKICKIAPVLGFHSLLFPNP